jgi:hypothetical protein
MAHLLLFAEGGAARVGCKESAPTPVAAAAVYSKERLQRKLAASLQAWPVGRVSAHILCACRKLCDSSTFELYAALAETEDGRRGVKYPVTPRLFCRSCVGLHTLAHHPIVAPHLSLSLSLLRRKCRA